MSLKSTSYLVLLFMGNIFVSCNRYIDIAKSKTHVPIAQGYFDFYPDSNVLLYKTNVILTRDTEKIYPKSFKVKLPKGLRFYKLSGSTDFGFYYDRKQVIFISIDLDNKEIKQDTAYSPNKDELNNFIFYKVSSAKSKYNIQKIPVYSRRKQMFIKKGAATIFLYNIKPRNYDLFFEYVNSFFFPAEFGNQ